MPKTNPSSVKAKHGCREVQEEDADVVEVYLLIYNHILFLFEEVVKKLEGKDTTCVDVVPIMMSFKDKMTKRREDGLYGYLTRVKLQRLSATEQNTSRSEFNEFFNTAIRYVEKWFNFSEENWLFSLQPLSLQGRLTFNDFQKVTEKLNLLRKLNIHLDELYDECTTANSTLVRLREDDRWKDKDTAAKWMAVFQAADLPNMLSVISYILSIPASTGYVERIFSRIVNKWSDSRKRCCVELMGSELLFTLNIDQSWADFYHSVSKDKQLLRAIRSDKKYTWKRK